jgi:hypothetical protein
MALSGALPASPYLARSKRSLQEVCMARRRWIVSPAGAAARECDQCILRPLCAPARAADDAAPAVGGAPQREDA